MLPNLRVVYIEHLLGRAKTLVERQIGIMDTINKKC